MYYEKSVSFEGDVKKTIEGAKSVLLPQNFKIVIINDTSIEFANTSRFVNQDPWSVVSSIRININDKKLSIEAELGGIKKIIKYMLLFWIGMSIFFTVVFGTLAYIFRWPMKTLIGLPLLFLTFLPAIPFMAIFLKFKANKSLEVLLNNMVALGQYG